MKELQVINVDRNKNNKYYMTIHLKSTYSTKNQTQKVPNIHKNLNL